MNEIIFEIIPNLDRLIEEKAFDELTGEEQNMLLNYMTIDEYENYRNAIVESKIMFSDDQNILNINPSIRENILNKFKSEKPKAKFIILKYMMDLINYRLPVYKFGLTISIAILFLFFFRPGFFSTTSYMSRIDTVYVDKVIKQFVALPDSQSLSNTDVINRAINKNKSKNTENSIKSEADLNNSFIGKNELDENIIQNAFNNIEMANKMKKGHTITDDSLLLKYFVTVY